MYIYHWICVCQAATMSCARSATTTSTFNAAASNNSKSKAVSSAKRIWCGLLGIEFWSTNTRIYVENGQLLLMLTRECVYCVVFTSSAWTKVLVSTCLEQERDDERERYRHSFEETRLLLSLRFRVTTTMLLAIYLVNQPTTTLNCSCCTAQFYLWPICFITDNYWGRWPN